MGTTEVVVQQNNEGPMIFGESANTNNKRYDCQQNSRSKILHAPMVPIGIDTITKSKITAPQSKGESGKGGGKNIQWYASAVSATTKEMETKGRWEKSDGHKDRK
jgi:hypothetical protein